MLRILHFSDIQFGELCLITPNRDVAESGFAKALVAAFARWPKPDLIALTGDITSRAAPAEFRQAKAFLRLMQVWDCEVPVAYVPGNHDLSWDLAKLSPQHLEYEAFGFAPYLLSELWPSCETLPCGNAAGGAVVQRLHLEDALVLGLNTAVKESPEGPHYGYVCEDQLAKLSALVPKEHDGTALRILLLHHHLRPLKDAKPYVDRSVATNAEALEAFVAQHRFDIILHGHRHHRYYHPINVGVHHAHVFCAASAGTIAKERYGGDQRCAVHLIEVEGRELGIAFGKRLTLEAHGSGETWHWRPAVEERFGPPLTPAELSNIAEQLVQTNAGSPHIGRQIASSPRLYGATTEELRRAFNERLAPDSELTNTQEAPDKWKVIARETHSEFGE